MLECLVWWVKGLWFIPYWYAWIIPVIIVLMAFVFVISLLRR